jgi:4-amino-4-deoxy-L-arabinose transferase-like glycosyltransferase
MKQDNIWLKIFFLVIIVFSVFLRFYDFRKTYLFSGDQGRDVIRVAKSWQELRPPLIGPVTSIGNMYLSPWYYYLMIPALFLSYPDPAGPGIMIAIFSIIGIILIYVSGRKIFGRMPSLLAAFLMSISATSIMYSRFSWNPNLAPLFSWLAFYFSYLAFKKRKPRFYLLAFINLGFLLSCHYVALLMVGAIGSLMICDFCRYFQKGKAWIFFKNGLLCLLILGFFFLPNLIFDLKNNGLNNKAFQSFFTTETAFRQNKSSTTKLSSSIAESRGRSMHIGYELVFGKMTTVAERYLAGSIIIAVIIILLLIFADKRKRLGIQLLFFIFVVSLIGLSLFQSTVYDHYILFLLPFVLMAYGLALDYLWNKNILGQILVLLFLGFYFYRNIERWPLDNLSWTVDDVKMTSEKIYQYLSPEDKYDLILISDSRDWLGQNYRYFFTTYENKPTPLIEKDKINKMIIIDENGEGLSALDPVWEWQQFGSKRILSKIIPIKNGPTVYILIK